MVQIFDPVFWRRAIVNRDIGKKRIDLLLLFSIFQGGGEGIPNQIPEGDAHVLCSFHGPSLQLGRKHDRGSVHEPSPYMHIMTAITLESTEKAWTSTAPRLP